MEGVSSEELEDDEEYGEEGFGDEIMQDDSWTVISAYFEEKGLVRQQLDSFNEFLEHSLQEIVEETADVEVTAEAKTREGENPQKKEKKKKKKKKKKKIKKKINLTRE
jgi:DNA-directed RNA polymerase II subunit RPB2